MLTNKSRWLSFRSTNGQKANKEMLQAIYKNMVLEDFINFGTDMSKGFPKQIASLLAAKVDVKDDTKVAVLNDLSFELYDELTDMGVKPENIYMVFGTWEKGGRPSMRRPVYEIMVDSAKANFEEFANDCTNFITTEELFNLNIKFDYIIANPPYAIGNEITRAVIDNVDFDKYINLMPLSKYKGQALYKNVVELELANPNEFIDASIVDNLCVCTLGRAIQDITYNDLSIITYDDTYKNFYQYNSKIKENYNYIANFSTGDKEKLPDVESSFMLVQRVAQVGVSKKSGHAKDLLYNIENMDSDIPWSAHSNTHSCMFLVFDTPLKKHNLCRFWYDNPLQNELIKGLRKGTGNINTAIPNIDWSKDRDYEHLTLEDIMQILREENPDVAE